MIRTVRKMPTGKLYTSVPYKFKLEMTPTKYGRNCIHNKQEKLLASFKTAFK